MKLQKPTAEVHDSEIVKVPALKEISFGDWEGLTYEQIKAKWPKDIETFFKKPAEVKISGGESFSDVQKIVPGKLSKNSVRI